MTNQDENRFRNMCEGINEEWQRGQMKFSIDVVVSAVTTNGCSDICPYIVFAEHLFQGKCRLSASLCIQSMSWSRILFKLFYVRGDEQLNAENL
jgi:hypothetical protein